jgi:hypothetical protein
MSIKRINEFPSASGVTLTADDVFLFMDDPEGSAITKKVSLSALSSVLGGGGGGSPTIAVVELGSVSGTINTPANSGQIFDITLSGSGLLANPTGGTDGQTVRWRISQGGAGNRQLSLGNKFRVPSTATSPLPVSTASGAMDILAATYDSGRDKWDVVAFVPGY